MPNSYPSSFIKTIRQTSDISKQQPSIQTQPKFNPKFADHPKEQRSEYQPVSTPEKLTQQQNEEAIALADY
ncbi:hypothetical protein BLD44_008140 [Mastigocladus laminosus UU774]|nr:hypothetical protein BLD44_008140 [Mastigocladus laminosus UU774]